MMFIEAILAQPDFLWLSVPWLLGLSGGGSSESGTTTQTETRTQRRGLLGPQRVSLAEALEPEFRNFTIPYLESQILGKPITRSTVVPGTPAVPGTLQIGSPQRVPIPSPEAASPGSQIEVEGNFDEPKRYFMIVPGQPEIVGAKAAVPESTKTETIGFESPFTFPSIDERGLYRGQVSALDRINALALSRLGVSPTDLTAIRESQFANIAPQLFDLVGTQTLKQKTIPRDIEHGRIEDLVNALHLSAGLLGGSSRGAATGSSLRGQTDSRFGFNPSPQLVQKALMAAIAA